LARGQRYCDRSSSEFIGPDGLRRKQEARILPEVSDSYRGSFRRGITTKAFLEVRTFPKMYLFGKDALALAAKIASMRNAQSSSRNIENGKVAPPRRQKNCELRTREYLTPGEVERLMVAAGKIGRHRHRDKTLLLMMYRHGLRVSEAVALRWDMVDLDQGLLHVQRRKNGVPSVHPLRGHQLRALRRLRRGYIHNAYVFTTERGGPMTTSGVRKVVTRAGKQAKIEFPVHPHMLRHGIGYKLANDGQDTRAIQHDMGHRSIQHTVRYTELAADRFNTLWRN
jgi:type 1 fimbriae regulatory protein FimB/type 1 fimbriae regulatory protein FimE